MPKGSTNKPVGELSRKPSQIRRRMRRAANRLDHNLDMYFEQTRPIEEWDLEELARGRPRDVDGHFRGRTPAWITPAVTREAKRRLLDHTFGTMAGHVDQAIVAIGNLITSDETDENGKPFVDARTRLEAAKFVIEHVLGKPKAVVELDGTDVVKSFLAAALVLDDGQDAHPVIDGQFHDGEEEENDDDG